MPTIVRDGKLRIVIYTNDHVPAHVHVLFDGRSIKVEITASRVHAIKTTGKPTTSEVAAAVTVAGKHLDTCLRAWKEIYG